MKKYGVTVPIVGYTYVEVESNNENEAIDKALDLCCDFDNKHVEIQELYGVKHVTQGNVVSHPCWHIDVEEIN